MSYFYVQTCPNGHYEITNRKLQEGAVCDLCKEPLMDKCPQCGEYIRKWTLYGATPILPGKKTTNCQIHVLNAALHSHGTNDHSN